MRLVGKIACEVFDFNDVIQINTPRAGKYGATHPSSFTFSQRLVLLDNIALEDNVEV